MMISVLDRTSKIFQKQPQDTIVQKPAKLGENIKNYSNLNTLE